MKLPKLRELSAMSGLLPDLLVTYGSAERETRNPHWRQRRLLLAIVEQALADADECNNIRPTMRAEAGAAIGWLLSPRKQPFTFRWICSMVGISADGAQEILRERYETLLTAARVRLEAARLENMASIKMPLSAASSGEESHAGMTQ